MEHEGKTVTRELKAIEDIIAARTPESKVIADRLASATLELEKAKKHGLVSYPSVKYFDLLGDVIVAIVKAKLNPEGFWQVGDKVGFVTKLSGKWHFCDPCQGWREIR